MTDERLQDLEMRFAFLDNTVDQLNKFATQQQLEIEQLKKQLEYSHQQLTNLKNVLKTQSDNEPPPHY